MKALRLALVAAALVLAACAPPPSRAVASTNSKVISSSELAAGTQPNLYDFVNAVRPRWLRPRTIGGRIPSSQRGGTLDAGTAITVFVDNMRVGGPEVLRGYSRDGIESLRFYDISEAQQRFSDMRLGVVIQINMVK